MVDEIAFLAAIRANPSDDTTRLVSADWLDEQGRPGGPFLRVDLCMDHEAFSRPVDPETDLETIYNVLLEGARRYPELLELVPVRAEDARRATRAGPRG
jgi:uncharacterized protein (TIGR02996 family)